MNSTTTNVSNWDKMLPHDPNTFIVPKAPDATINYKKAHNASLSLAKPRAVTLTAISKQPGRDKNLQIDERIKNVYLENTKDIREAKMKEAKELKKKFPNIIF